MKLYSIENEIAMKDFPNMIMHIADEVVVPETIFINRKHKKRENFNASESQSRPYWTGYSYHLLCGRYAVHAHTRPANTRQKLITGRLPITSMNLNDIM